MKRGVKKQNIIQLILVIGIIVLANFISAFVFTRIDLTGDKRFTISESSKTIMGNLKDLVYVKVYLDGDFPPGFQKLENATREMLDELRNYSNGNLEYEFINPSASTDEQERNNFYRQLAEKGLTPTNLEEQSKEGTSQKIVFPGALVSFSTQEIPVQLLKDQIGVSSVQMLNNSIQNLEYEIISAIKKATNPLKPTIGFTTGHGEVEEKKIQDIAAILKISYDVSNVELGHTLGALDKFKALIIAKPDSTFDDKSKFILDQYIMHGGRVFWLLDQMDVTMDSLGNKGETMALGRQINLDDMLFRYGVRINYDLVLDLQSAPIPVVTGYVGNQPRTELRPWYYFPLLSPFGKHPIVNNLNSVRGQFVSTLDTVGAPTITKTILLTTSEYTRIAPAPVRVNLGIMQLKPNPKQYNQKHLPVAVLLEGNFESIFKNRPIPDTIRNSPQINFKEQSAKPTRMVIIADGDVITNDFQKGKPLACGYDKYSGTFFGNRSFVQNVMDYLADDSGLMSVRNKEFKLRLLDPQVLESNGQSIRIFNCIFPPFLVLLFALAKFYIRRKKYSA
ncbi:MAG: gliding motility-associated ABC transporter substrate-binding protein GldG [Bacteroidota bacterium]